MMLVVQKLVARLESEMYVLWKNLSKEAVELTFYQTANMKSSNP